MIESNVIDRINVSAVSEENPPSPAVYSFRETLFLQTVKWCYNKSPFYKRKLADVINDIHSLKDISKLPVLFRDEIVRNHDDMQCLPGPPAHVQYTTGTTGQFLQLNRSYEEAQFIHQFFSSEIASNISPGTIRPLLLTLTSAWHGSPTPIPGWGYVLQAGVYDRTQAQTAKNLLLKTYNFPNITPKIAAVMGSDLLIKILTAYLVEEEVNPADTGVQYLILTGGYLSPSRKKLLSNLWNATVIDRFSMSEVFGGARELNGSGKWAFDVEVMPEVLHPRTLQPVQSSIGVLTLTGLYPFVQMMPFLRYYTGDLVEIERYNFDQGRLLVKFLGREKWSVIDSSEDEVVPLILAGPLYEIIESFPDVAIQARFSDIGLGASAEIAGKHLFTVTNKVQPGEQQEIEISLGLRYSPWLFPEATATLCSTLRKKLYEAFPALKQRVLNESIKLTITPLPASKVQPFSMK